MIPKFRAWDSEANIMIYSDHRTRKLYDVYYGFEMNEKGELECRWEGDFTESQVLDGGILDNIMQSTGLKDKNGVEIYVGDIVILTSKSINYADTYWHNYAEVFKHPNGAYRLRGKGMYETELYSNRKQVTLTGNIYETPELLENDRFCTDTDDPNC